MMSLSLVRSLEMRGTAAPRRVEVDSAASFWQSYCCNNRQCRIHRPKQEDSTDPAIRPAFAASNDAVAMQRLATEGIYPRDNFV
jgi:hypothetical protein